MQGSNLLCRLVTCLGLIGCSASCDNVANEDRKEVARLTSPDSVVDAVMVETNCGATCPFAYEVTVAPRGAVNVSSEPLLVIDHAVGLELRWSAPRQLDIVFDSARIYQFKNFWSSRDIQNYAYVVELHLAPRSTGSVLNARDRGWGDTSRYR